MKKIIAAAIAAMALAAPLASAAPTTMSVDLPGGAKKEVTVSRATLDSLTAAENMTAAVQMKTALDLIAAEEAKKAAEFAKKAKELSEASDATLKPLSKAACADWAADQTDPDLAFEALRVRWNAERFPSSVTSDEGKTLWLLRGSGGGSASVTKLRRETEAALHVVKSEIGGVRQTLVDKGVVSDVEVVAAVNKLLSQDKFTLGGGEATPAPPDEGGVRVVVLPAGDD